MNWTEWYRVTYRHVSGPEPSRTPMGFASFYRERQTVNRAGLGCTVNPSYEPDAFAFVVITKKSLVDQMRAALPKEMSGGGSIVIKGPVPDFERRRELQRMGVSDAREGGFYGEREEPTVVKLESVEHIKSDPSGNIHVEGQCPELIEGDEKRGETRLSSDGNEASEGNPQGLTDNQAAEASTSTAATSTPDVDTRATEPGDSTDPEAPTADPAITGTIELEDRSIVVTVLVIAAALAFAWWWRENVTT